ncbi:hypothetical protein PPYR_07512 [Photinus pyralis]|uniref:Uncharacterized protein n=2 Tax=Photinus pyralis TaxID=7054 RepID=A0A5N4AQK1_PHOPY|nr:general odorant-binding protein 28a-like [Photinus pyralis]KAB0799632.1 hypothetical protein PPYR_07512 [Photinus pyralis]
MKCVISLLFLFTAAYGVSDEFKNALRMKMATFASACISEVGAGEADITDLVRKRIPSTREGRCLISCLQKKFGLQQSDGQPDRLGTMALLEPLHDDDPEMYKKVLQVAITCGPLVEKMKLTDACDVAVEVTTCAMREGKKFGLEDPFGLNR